MLIKPDCIPCILTMSLTAIRKLSLDENFIKDLTSDILNIPALTGKNWEVTSPEVIELVMEKISRAVNDTDPFLSEKISLNESVLKIYPFIEKLVEDATDPLYMAVRLAILGNSIDFMLPGGTSDIKEFLLKRLEAPIVENEYLKFKNRLKACQNIVYFADNSGEIVFDKLLIQTILKKFDLNVTFVVRSTPTMNDATKKEATSIGIEPFVELVENGIKGPLPGTILKRCSEKINQLVNQSDLIISKGGGNFDCLSEEIKSLNKNFTFMLLSKCTPYNKKFGAELYYPILANYPKTQN